MQSKCRDLICLDTRAIRKKLWATYKRAKASLAKVENELTHFNATDKAGFEDFMRKTFGAEMSKIRECEEKIHLYESRLSMLQTLADEKSMSPEKVAHSLQERVTPEKDLWRLLQEEYDVYLDEQRKEEEERQRRREERRANRKKRFDPATGEIDLDEELREGDFSSIDELFEELFDHILGTDDEEDSEGHASPFDFSSILSEQKDHELKHIYRELCMKFHPDRIGDHDAATQDIWNRIQEAYQKNDLASLLALRDTDTWVEGSDAVQCSEILRMIQSLKHSSSCKRRDLRAMKREPSYGFSSWKPIKLKKVTRDAQAEYTCLIESLDCRISSLEREIHRILKWKPRTPRTRKTTVQNR